MYNIDHISSNSSNKISNHCDHMFVLSPINVVIHDYCTRERARKNDLLRPAH
eukprot:UN14443